jgi:hypothetical protein
MIEKMTPWEIPFYLLTINQWETKKKKLIELIEECRNSFEKKDDNYTTYYQTTKDDYLTKKIANILYEDFLQFQSYLGRNLIVHNSWFQIYTENENHGIHTHPESNLSSVIYIEYDENDHLPTQFISPFLNLFDGGNVMGFSPKVKEGQILFFPSLIMHHVKPNASKKNRIIASVNFNIEKT